MKPQEKATIREALKEGLALCSNEQVAFFKRMYSPQNPHASNGHVVDTMPESKLKWALQQVERTLQKFGAQDEAAKARESERSRPGFGL